MRTLVFSRFFVLAGSSLIAAMLMVESADAQQGCVPAPEDILAWWPLDENAGGSSFAKDIIGGHDASYVGTPVTVPGKVGNAIHLDGIEDCLSVPDDPVWDFGASEFTFEFWMSLDAEPDGSASQPGNVLVAHSEGPFNVNKYIFALAPGQLEFIAYNAATDSGGVAPVTPWSPGTGVLFHVALTRSGTEYRVYIDGELADTEENLETLPDANATLLFGCVQEFWGGFHYGGLDEIAAYGRALTAEEIAAIVAAGPAGKCVPPPTTTTTSTSTSTSTTTSSTMPPPRACGDVDDNGTVTASDALSILKAAVGGPECDASVCFCNVDGNDRLSAADALLALKIAVGQPLAPHCDC